MLLCEGVRLATAASTKVIIAHMEKEYYVTGCDLAESNFWCAPRIFPWGGGGGGADPEAIYNLCVI
jgi:hypothetical protein